MRKDSLKGQAGFSLLEVLVSIFILSLVVGPFISLFVQSLHHYYKAGERTQALFVTQGLVESLLDLQLGFPSTSQEFKEHPQWPQYEYRIIIVPYQGASLKKITVELREKDNPDKAISLITLKARRKSSELATK